LADEAPVVLVLALTVPLLLRWASATPDPIRIGSAPAEPTGKLNLGSSQDRAEKSISRR